MNRAETLQQQHDRLCFLRAFPRSAAELRRAESALAGFERRVTRVKDELDNSGIAGTSCRYPYNHTMATWLAARYGRAVTIDWKAYKRHAWDEVAALLSLAVACAENEGSTTTTCRRGSGSRRPRRAAARPISSGCSRA